MVTMHPPETAHSNAGTSQRRAHPQKLEERGNKEGGEGEQAGGGYELRHAGGYLPHLARISIGQDRKYTIEGSSATDKDYPINTKNGKQANQCLSRKFHRSDVGTVKIGGRLDKEKKAAMHLCLLREGRELV